MKTLLAIVPLAFCSCVSTTATYEGDRRFPAPVVNPLEVTIDYSLDSCTGSARTTTILGIIKLGRSTHAYAKASGGGLAVPNIGQLLGGSTESAAVYDALAQTGGDVLGFPMFRKKATNYFLWKVEDVWVKGFSGKVGRGAVIRTGNPPIYPVKIQ